MISLAIFLQGCVSHSKLAKGTNQVVQGSILATAGISLMASAVPVGIVGATVETTPPELGYSAVALGIVGVVMFIAGGNLAQTGLEKLDELETNLQVNTRTEQLSSAYKPKKLSAPLPTPPPRVENKTQRKPFSYP